jgi:hypothetical protein
MQNNEKKTSSVRKRKKELVPDKSSEQNPHNENPENVLTCDDCRHNSITYEPSKNGACDCGCH